MSTIDARVKELESLLHDQPKNPLRPSQRQGWEEEMRRVEKVATAPDWQAGDAKGRAVPIYRRIKKDYDTQVPKPVSEAQRKDRIAALVKALKDDVIAPAMLPVAVMKSNPPGAVDAYRKGEASPGVKRAILATKRAMWALEPECPDQDYTNFESLRPQQGRAGFPQFDAQITRGFGMTPQAKENWPLGEGTAPSAVEQVKRREITEAQRTALTKGRASRPATEAQREALARGRAARQAKLAAAGAAQEG